MQTLTYTIPQFSWLSVTLDAISGEPLKVEARPQMPVGDPTRFDPQATLKALALARMAWRVEHLND
jgi:hypothetical protein